VPRKDGLVTDNLAGSELEQREAKDAGNEDGQPAGAEPLIETRQLATSASVQGTFLAAGDASLAIQASAADGKADSGSRRIRDGKKPAMAGEPDPASDDGSAAQSNTAAVLPAAADQRDSAQAVSREQDQRAAGQGLAKDSTEPATSAAQSAPARQQLHLQDRTIAQGPDAARVHEVDRVRFVQRVARAFQAVDAQGGQVRLRLSPPELGSMRLEVTVRGGVLSARMETETHAARSLLLDHLPALRERLAEQNISVERFEVDLMNGQSGGNPGRPSEQAASHERLTRRAARTGPERSGEADSAARASPPLIGDTQLNVVI
jgi:flagellar hook-length control protein FliK